MPLLELDQVSTCSSGRLSGAGLDHVSLEIESAEWVGVWGGRRSGRSTLLRVAAGIQKPSSGVVRYCGRALDIGALHPEIAFCRTSFRVSEGQSVLEQLLSVQETIGVGRRLGSDRAYSVLRRTDAEQCAELAPHELDPGETIRVAFARALASRPRLLIADEPTVGVDLAARDSILLLIRSIADDGVAVLTSTGEAPCLAGTDRALTISDGRLRGALVPAGGTVLPLRREEQPAA